MTEFTAYVALGDSMSIDLYPALDAGRDSDAPVGAASLLFQNDPLLWPQFAGKDLANKLPQLKFANLAVDGATTFDVLDPTYLQIVDSMRSEKLLITLTIGGNDALQMLSMQSDNPAQLTAEVANMVERYKRVVAKIISTFRHSSLIVGTIYDPSDGTGNMPNFPPFADKLPFLRYINDEIRKCAADNKCMLADIYQRFFGHGMTAPPAERYYWHPNPIEPSARGASELRALWLETMERQGLF